MRIQNAIKGMLAVTIVTVGIYVSTIGANAAGTCKVSEGAAKIRATASTSAEVVGSTSKGAKLDVISSTSDGTYTWYKVYVEGNKTGYIRGDLVTDVSGDIASEGGTATTTTSNDSSTSTSASTTVVSPCEYTTGSTKDQVSVRESASTNSSKKTTADAGQALSITGQAIGDDGKTWYQINYGNVTGFIRSDFVDVSAGSELGETEETGFDDQEIVDEEESFEDDVIEAPAPTTVSDDYELRYEANDEGTEMWYLYDHIKGTRQSLDNIFAVMQQSQNLQAQDKGSDSKMKPIIIIMGIVIFILIIVITILIFKLRDSYEDWEDDDDDDDDDDYVKPAPARRSAARSFQYEDDDEDIDDDDVKIVSRREKPKKTSALTKPSRAVVEDRKEAWQSKNFLEIDDDMEFEFLDIDK